MTKFQTNLPIIFSKTALIFLGISFVVLSSYRTGKKSIKPLYGVISQYKQTDLTTSFPANKTIIRL